MRIPESQIRRAAMVELLNARGCRLSTSDLIARLTARMKPVGRDAEILNGRGDTYFSQKVRNLVSHRAQSSGLEFRGFADYDAPSETWTLTAVGRSEAARLSQLP